MIECRGDTDTTVDRGVDRGVAMGGAMSMVLGRVLGNHGPSITTDKGGLLDARQQVETLATLGHGHG